MENNSIIKPGMRVSVMGLGVSGRSAVRFAQACGAQVSVSDCREQAGLLAEAGEFLQATKIAWEAGGHTAEFLMNAELVLVSPGIPYDHPVLKNLSAANIPCLGELAVAAPLLNVPVIAVTGTNGKTTVTTLVGELLKASGKRVFVGGNIGTPLFEYLLADQTAEVIVLETSSFQLQQAGSFAPEVALLLNITPDHLDRHDDLTDYVEAKLQIFRHQRPEDIAIVSADDPLCASLTNRIDSRLFTFGQDATSSARISGDRITLNWQGRREIYDLAGTQLASPIGAGNSAAAILAARAVGADADAVRKGLQSFQSLAHRLEMIRELDGVAYVNDSKATNTGAVVAALNQVSGKAVLIAGGKHKGEDYSLLRDSVQEKVRRVLLIGEAAKAIGAALSGVAEVEFCDSLEEAVLRARCMAEPGDTVLLSPACASFDMFRSYGHRGEVFAAAVRTLERAGEETCRGERDD